MINSMCTSDPPLSDTQKHDLSYILWQVMKWADITFILNRLDDISKAKKLSGLLSLDAVCLNLSKSTS